MKKLLFVAWAIFGATAYAGSVAFLADGKHVIRAEGRELRVRGLQDPVETVVPVPAELKGEQLQLARHRDGGIVVVGDRQAMEWNPVSGEWKSLCDAPVDLSFNTVACDPKSGDILFVLETTDWTYWQVLPVERQGLKRVFNRRAEYSGFPAFDADGTLYFSREGDVWKGALEKDAEQDRYILVGQRIWPLAELETALGTPDSAGAHGIAPLTTHLLISRGRLGGSGWGAVVRVPKVNAYEKKLPLAWEKLRENPWPELASSPDGTQAALYERNGNRWFLLEKPDGELVPLPSSQDKADH